MTQDFGPAARQELLQAAQWYLGEGGTTLAGSFERAVQRALLTLALMPRIGSPSHAGTRTWPIKDFPYTLVYRVLGDALTVIAVAHQSREPGYWRDRA